jgi:hypothetical protein
MGCSSSSVQINIPSRPNKEIYYVRYPGELYGTQNYKLYINTISHEQLQTYIVKQLFIYKCHYKYLNQECIIIYNISSIIFNNMFANLRLVETVDVPIYQEISPTAPPSDDPI